MSAVLATLLVLVQAAGSGGFAAFYTLVVGLSTMAAVIPYAFCALAGSLVSARVSGGVRVPRVTIVEIVAFVFAMFTLYGCGAEPVLYGLVLLLLGIPVFVWQRRRAAPTGCRDPILMPTGDPPFQMDEALPAPDVTRLAVRHRDLGRITLTVLFIGGLIVTSIWIMRPFLPAILWATTLVLATWPLMLAGAALRRQPPGRCRPGHDVGGAPGSDRAALGRSKHASSPTSM